MRGARLFSILVALGATLLTGGVASAAGHLVRITSTLDPATITIAPGDRITWRNDDGDRHRIRSTSGPAEFDSGNLEPGQTFRITLTKVGRYEYYDHRNDELTSYYGLVIVKEARASDPDVPAEPGTPNVESPSTATIAIGDRVFRPRSVTIAAGGSVTWRNDDDREHTATSSSGVFDTGTLSPGESARRSFPNAGTFSFLCLIHPDMTGTITVTGSGGGGGGGDPAPTRPTEPDKSAEPAQPDTASGEAVIRDFEFAPAEVAVTPGSTVTWTNEGMAPHTVTSSDDRFESGQLDPGDSFTQRFETTGRFEYVCAIHPFMTGVVLVRAAESGAPEPTPIASESAPPPSGDAPSPAASGGPGPAPGDDGGGPGAITERGGDAGAAASSRQLGEMLLVVALIGAIVLAAGATLGFIRARLPGVPDREVAEGGG